jgi:hypothetical protein
MLLLSQALLAGDLIRSERQRKKTAKERKTTNATHTHTHTYQVLSVGHDIKKICL